MYPFCIQAPSNRAVSSCLLLNLSPRAVSGWSLRPRCKYSSSLESVLGLIYIIIYICHLTEFFLNPFIYQLCSKSVIVADINNRSEKMTNKPATLYARISCTRSFLAQRNKVKLIYIRLIWGEKMFSSHRNVGKRQIQRSMLSWTASWPLEVGSTSVQEGQ